MNVTMRGKLEWLMILNHWTLIFMTQMKQACSSLPVKNLKSLTLMIQNYKREEDTALCRSFINLFKNAIEGTEKTGNILEMCISYLVS